MNIKAVTPHTAIGRAMYIVQNNLYNNFAPHGLQPHNLIKRTVVHVPAAG